MAKIKKKEWNQSHTFQHEIYKIHAKYVIVKFIYVDVSVYKLIAI